MNKTDVILDECYKETLARVRPYVLELSSAESAQLCKVWLNKLNAASSQRRLRNEYLLELYRQLKTGHIKGIFSRPPCNGLLLPLPKPHHTVCISSSVSDLSDCAMKSHRNCLRPSAKCVQHQRSNALIKHHMMDMRKLQAQNEYLKNQLVEYRGNHNGNADNYLSASVSRLTADVIALKAKLPEVQKIKNYLEESYKETIQEYHYSVVEQFTKLKHQLEDERMKNETLNNSIIMISEKLEEIIHGKDIGIKEMEKQWMDKINLICERFDALTREKDKELQQKQDLLEKKDAELLKKDAGRKEEIETLSDKISDLEAKLETKIKDGDKLQAMLIEQYTTMKEEFSKMRIEIDHESQKQNEHLMSKVSALKKAVMKLEKSKERLEYDYEKKMSNIIKNKDIEIKTLQLRLQEQKNELCTYLNRKKQSEMDKVVGLLEEQYRTLLAETEAKAECQTQEYLRVLYIRNVILNVKFYFLIQSIENCRE
ncbi:uncharacterized protein LOC117604489 isoform X3 [Osmia lignaria lignaria]|uniref:uncharacterized protein LOC117604489 isoform X3 n=1 Tax=Osmia lignaria lignaria TaxID=1437193 RepID=UPI001478CECF|nr:paramyosin-like isoform X3 [Osmia lignaria]